MLIGKKGIIKGGTTDGWFILIQDDSENTGGYLLLQSPNENFIGEGYDNWFLSLDEVNQHLELNKLNISWLD